LTVRICPIVEGDGERHSIRDLITRIAAEFWNENEWVDVLTSIQRPRGKLMNTDDFERAVETAAIKLQAKGGGAILVLIDSDNECPAHHGPALLARANQRCHHMNIPVSVVLAHCEYEAWFLASASSLASIGTLPIDLENHPHPETKRGAKEWLNERMTDKYSETRHQPSFTNVFNLQMARRGAPSFDKLCRDLERMFAALHTPSPPE
jgi:Domain of unknown function (DUF4276)